MGPMRWNEIILETGIGFGLTSGIITTLGLIVGCPPARIRVRSWSAGF